MKIAIVILAALFVISGLATWARGAFVHHTDLTAAVSMPVVRTPGTPLETDSDVLSLSGIAIMDTSGGTPAVPYIQYTNASGNIATKQLIFADARGCLPTAGDIPCVPGRSVNAAY